MSRSGPRRNKTFKSCVLSHVELLIGAINKKQRVFRLDIVSNTADVMLY